MSPIRQLRVIVCFGGAGLFDKHLASAIHCVDEEIIGSLQRREQRRRARAVMPYGNPGGDWPVVGGRRIVSSMSWDPKDVALLKKLWAVGQSAAQIARRFGCSA